LIALDTNILVYSVTSSDIKGRHEAAIVLLSKLASGGAMVALPVFGEFLNACRQKKQESSDIARSRVEIWLSVYECPAPVPGDCVAASKLARQYVLRYYDALILSIVCRAGATILLSEDMPDGLEPKHWPRP
jgi:predicted nucleic acid-binding protein